MFHITSWFLRVQQIIISKGRICIPCYAWKVLWLATATHFQFLFKHLMMYRPIVAHWNSVLSLCLLFFYLNKKNISLKVFWRVQMHLSFTLRFNLFFLYTFLICKVPYCVKGLTFQQHVIIRRYKNSERKNERWALSYSGEIMN